MLGLRERLISITLKPLRRVKNAKSALAVLDLLIFLAIGGILSALATGALEIRYEKNFDEIQNLKRENFILNAAKQNTESDRMFYLVFLFQQEDYFHSYFELLEGWALGTEAEFKNIFFGFDRLVETQRTLIKLAPDGSNTVTASKERIEALQQTRRDSDAYLKKTLSKITPENVLDLHEQTSAKNEQFLDQVSRATESTIGDIQLLIVANSKRLKLLRNEQSKLNWWASRIFLFSFALQILIFGAYHSFEIFFDRRTHR